MPDIDGRPSDAYRDATLGLLTLLFASIAPAYTLWSVLNTSKMQFLDYFGMVDSLYSSEGQFVPLGLLDHANEHFVLIPKIVYALNIVLFSGSNVTLGVAVWMTAATLAVLVYMAMRSSLPGKEVRAAAIFAIAALAFPIGAAHNFLHAMSGTAWMAANLLAVIAIMLAERGRLAVALVVAVLATLSYGTGLAVWPALMVLFLLRQEQSAAFRVVFPLGAIAVLVERFSADTVANHPAITVDPVQLVRSTIIAAGSSLGGSVESALIIGTVLVVIFVVVSHAHMKIGLTRASVVLVSVGCYSLTALVLFAAARTGISEGSLLSSRYIAVSSLFLLSIAGQWVVYPLPGLARYWSTCGVALLSILAGVPNLHAVEDRQKEQDVVGIALRLGIGEGRLRGMLDDTAATLEALHHYPFNRGVMEGCGEMPGSVVADESIEEAADVHGYIDHLEFPDSARGADVSGWVAAEDGNVECLLLIDSGNRVVGAGRHGFLRDDVRRRRGFPLESGWKGVARVEEGEALRALVRVGDARSYHPLRTTDAVSSRMWE